MRRLPLAWRLGFLGGVPPVRHWRRRRSGEIVVTYDEDSMLFAAEPRTKWLPQDVDALLLWAAEIGASDIVLASGIRPRIRLHGAWRSVGNRPLETESSLRYILDEVTRSKDAWARLQGREFLDPSYEVAVPGDREKRKVRFRLNATACRDGADIGISLVFRTIPEVPPKLDALGVESDLRPFFFPNNGLVLVTGVMGSGKSTLLGGVMREIVETTDKHILTYEAPVEFDLMRLNDTTGSGAFVVQTEIGRHVESFKVAPKNSTRRAADVVLYGEVRDVETVGGMIEQAEVGTTVYATLHTPSVASTPGRIINMFPAEDKPSMSAGFLGSIRLIVQQRLLKTRDKKRCAVREWLAFDEGMRKSMLGMALADLHVYLDEQVERRGMPLLRSAQRLFDDGILLESELEQVEAEKRAERDAAGGHP